MGVQLPRAGLGVDALPGVQRCGVVRALREGPGRAGCRWRRAVVLRGPPLTQTPPPTLQVVALSRAGPCLAVGQRVGSVGVHPMGEHGVDQPLQGVGREGTPQGVPKLGQPWLLEGPRRGRGPHWHPQQQQ